MGFVFLSVLNVPPPQGAFVPLFRAQLVYLRFFSRLTLQNATHPPNVILFIFSISPPPVLRLGDFSPLCALPPPKISLSTP